MARSKKENEIPWMEKLADKYGISLDTVLGFYDSITYDHYDHARRVTKRQRTEEFFELYFEGVKGGM